MPTKVPKINWTENGAQLPTESQILLGVQADINSAFGGGVNPQLTTPQGQIAQSNTAIIGDANSNINYVANMVNPDFAVGRWQDAIGRIYFLERHNGSGTVVTCDCIGAVGSIIPFGALVQDNNGYYYRSTAGGIIPAGGKLTLPFQNTMIGPIGVPANNVNKIIQAVIGWDTVNNPAAGIPGTNTESRADFEFRRINSVAIVGLNSVSAVRGAVLTLDGVIDCYVIDNPTGDTVESGATLVKLKPHSIYVCVAGGAAPEIARAIWEKKSAGCDYNGNTSYTITDDTYPVPKPEYKVTWQTPTAVPIFFTVNIVDDERLPAEIDDLTKAAIISHFNGQDGAERARIGSAIYASSFYGVITGIDPTVNIQSLFIGTKANPNMTSVTMGIDQIPTIDPNNIAVNLIKTSNYWN